MRLVIASSREQTRRSRAAHDAFSEIDENRIHPRRIRTRRFRSSLSAAQFRRSHHLHRLGDFLSRLDR
jgi:hypothetical protein